MSSSQNDILDVGYVVVSIAIIRSTILTIIEIREDIYKQTLKMEFG